MRLDTRGKGRDPRRDARGWAAKPSFACRTRSRLDGALKSRRRLMTTHLNPDGYEYGLRGGEVTSPTSIPGDMRPVNALI